LSNADKKVVGFILAQELASLTKRKKRRKRCTPQRKKCSKVAHNQKSQNVQPKREIVKEKLGELSRC